MPWSLSIAIRVAPSKGAFLLNCSLACPAFMPPGERWSQGQATIVDPLGGMIYVHEEQVSKQQHYTRHVPCHPCSPYRPKR